MTRGKFISVVMGGGLLLGCVERPLLGGDTTGDGGGSSTSGGGGTTSGVPTSSGQPSTGPGATSSGTGPQPGTTTGSTGSESTTVEDTCGFICPGTTGGESTDKLCDLFQQNCPEGEKCASYAEGGGIVWNATKCVPVTGDAGPGEPCTAVGGGISGFDDCPQSQESCRFDR